MINGKYSYRIRPKDENEVEHFKVFLERHGALEEALKHVTLMPTLYEVSFDLEVRYLNLTGWCSHVHHPSNQKYVGNVDGFIDWYEGEGTEAPEKKALVGLTIDKGEQEELFKICKRFAIPITHPELFEDGKFHPKWALSAVGIGLIDADAKKRLRKMLYGLYELTHYLLSLGSGPTPDYKPQGQPIVVRAESDEELQALISILSRDYDFRGNRPIREGGPKGPFGGSCPWIFANVEGRSFWRGKAGICYARPVFNRWIKPEDFLAILKIVYRSKKISED